jgi:hypothetical protein
MSAVDRDRIGPPPEEQNVSIPMPEDWPEVDVTVGPALSNIEGYVRVAVYIRGVEQWSMEIRQDYQPQGQARG